MLRGDLSNRAAAIRHTATIPYVYKYQFQTGVPVRPYSVMIHGFSDNRTKLVTSNATPIRRKPGCGTRRNSHTSAAPSSAHPIVSQYRSYCIGKINVMQNRLT